MGKGADNYISVMFQISETLTFDLPKKRTLSDLLPQMSVTVFFSLFTYSIFKIAVAKTI